MSETDFYRRTNKDTEKWFDGIKHFCDCFETIPDSFHVHTDYLIDGMTESEFVSAYKQYQAVFKMMQDEIYNNPEEYALLKCDSKNILKPACSMIHQILWLFVSLAQSGEIIDDVLYVNGKSYLEYINGKSIGSHDATPKSVDCLLPILSKFGFVLENYHHNTEINFTVSAPLYPRLMTVIKASTLTQQCKKSLMSDYCSFNSRIYSIPAKSSLPMEISHSYFLMSEENKAFISGLLKYLFDLKWRVNGTRHHRHDHGWISLQKNHHWEERDGININMGQRIEIYYSLEHIHLLINGGDSALSHIDSLSLLPHPYGEIWSTGLKCRGCLKGECKARRSIEADGKQSVYCAQAKVGCPINSKIDLPIIKEIVNILTS